VPDPALAQRRSALVRRAFSLSGVVPLGAFLVIHVATNARALAGEDAFVGAARGLERIPGLGLIEVLLVFAPLLFHGAFGLWLTVRRIPLATPSPYPRTVGVAMRVTGVLAAAFLVMHLPELRFRTPGVRPDGAILLTVLAARLSSMTYGLPWRAVLYMLGAACVCFHFAGGLWGFFAGTARGQAARARTWGAWWAAAVGLILWGLFAETVVFHATGARLMGGGPHDAESTVPCPTPSGSAAE